MQYRRTVIALDFDRTFTADRQLWYLFITSAVSRGHKVYCVTSRSDKPENREIIKRAFGNCYPVLHGVIFTAHQPKRVFMESLGIKVDWWFDDAPETIGNTDPAVLADFKSKYPSDETVELLDRDGQPINLYPAKTHEDRPGHRVSEPGPAQRGGAKAPRRNSGAPRPKRRRPLLDG